MLEKIELDNGLEVYRGEMDTEEIGIGLQVGIGSAFEPDEILGASHFIEHVMFSSNEKYTEDEMLEIFEFSGGDFGATTSHERTIVYGSVLKESFGRVLEAIYHAFKNTSFREKEFKKEKGVIKSEISRLHDNPDVRIWDLLDKSVFSGSPYSRSISGTHETIDRMNPDDLAEFKEKYYVPNNCRLILLGPVDEEEIEAVRRFFGGMDSEKLNRKNPGLGQLKSKNKTREDIEEGYFGLGWRTEIEDLEDFVNNEMLDMILSSGFTSLLFDEYRSERGIGYLARSHFSPFRDSGYMVMTVNGFDMEREKEVKETARDILQRARNLSDKYLEGRKTYSKYKYTENLKRMNWITKKIAKFLAAGFEVDGHEAMEKLTDLNRDRFRSALKNIEPVEAVIRPEK